MSDEELSISDVTLIARLRAVCTCNIDSTPCMAEDDCRDALAAAARIETLVKEKEQLGREVNMARYGQPDFAWSIHEDAMADLEAKLAKALEALLWCSGSADFNEGGVAREGWLKVCAPLLKGESHD